MRTRGLINDARGRHELRFVSLFDQGRAVAVPCDAHGSVDLDLLSERMRLSYFSARARMGRDFAYPIVRRVDENLDSADLTVALIRRSRGTY
jgi:hypothetical protein